MTNVYMHQSKYVQENKTDKILLDWTLKPDHEILVKSSYLLSINKKRRTGKQVDFAMKIKESKRQGQTTDLSW